jgi:DNA repair exonuclease SbcCD nuclease subunit
MPDNIRLFSVRNPETAIIEELGVAIHGQGYPKRAVTENLSEAYPAALPHYFNIGLLHTSLDGREGHEPYAPANVSNLLSKGYEYWALGHVHAQEIIHKDPWILFPGNTQGRNIRETGKKGCMLVEIEDGCITRVEPREVDVMRWAVASVDAKGSFGGDQVLDEVSGTLLHLLKENNDIPLAVRIEIVGRTKAHREFLSDPERWKTGLRGVAADTGRGMIWLEKIRFNTQEAQDSTLYSAKGDVLNELMNSIEELSGGTDLVKTAVEGLKDLYEKLPNEIKSGDEAIRLKDPETIRRAAEGARQFLLDRILFREKEI